MSVFRILCAGFAEKEQEEKKNITLSAKGSLSCASNDTKGFVHRGYGTQLQNLMPHKPPLLCHMTNLIGHESGLRHSEQSAQPWLPSDSEVRITFDSRKKILVFAGRRESA